MEDNDNKTREYDITKNPHFNKLLEILACPKCKGKIAYEQDNRRWICVDCSRYYFIENGVPNFLIDESVIVVKSPKTGKLLEFDSKKMEYSNKDGEVFRLADIEKVLDLRLKCLEEGCDGSLAIDNAKLAYICNKCNTEYPVPNGITNCLKENAYS